jgi:hypothetical protein
MDRVYMGRTWEELLNTQDEFLRAGIRCTLAQVMEMFNWINRNFIIRIVNGRYEFTDLNNNIFRNIYIYNLPYS